MYETYLAPPSQAPSQRPQAAALDAAHAPLPAPGPEVTVCPTCGAALETTCPLCGCSLTLAYRYCTVCGANLTAPPVPRHCAVCNKTLSVTTVAAIDELEFCCEQCLQRYLLENVKICDHCGLRFKTKQAGGRGVTDLRLYKNSARYYDFCSKDCFVKFCQEHAIDTTIYLYTGVLPD